MTASTPCVPRPMPSRSPRSRQQSPSSIRAQPARVYADRLMHLWGNATSYAGAAIDPEAVEWFIDDKAVGKGFDLWVETPGVGRHRLRMQVTEGALTGVAGNEFEVIGDGEPAKSD